MGLTKRDIKVVGGTPFDAGRGVVFLKSKGIESIAIGLSDNPDEQTALYQFPDKVVQRFIEKVDPREDDQIIIFCNSLSFMADWPALFPCKIWTLTEYYAAIFKNLGSTNVVIMVAEESMVTNLNMLIHNLQLPVDVEIFPDLNLIKQIEKSSEQEQLALIKNELKKLASLGFSTVIFGCTHFDHPEFNRNQYGLHIYQPGLNMLQDVFNYLKIK